MQISWWTALELVGWVAVVGSAVSALLYTAFLKWGEQWIENRFATRLQELKQVHESRLEDLKAVHESRLQESEHIHQRELESIRSSIQHTFSRVSKIHEREFEVFPRIWFMIQDALGSAFSAIEHTVIEYPPFGKMSDENVKTYIEAAGFSDFQTQHILQLSNPDERASQYVKILRHRYSYDAKEKQRILNNYIIENRVFMTPELDEMLTDVSHTLANGLSAYASGKWGNDPKLEREGVENITNVQPKLPKILKAIQDRLCHTAAGTSSLGSAPIRDIIPL